MADQLASYSPSQALTKKSLDTELMPPPPPIKRIKRPPVVLDEDTYTEALSEIIARDFFPGLLEAKHQQEYLDALDSKDAEWIREASKKLSEVMTPQYRNKRRRIQRHHTGFTPMTTWGSAATPRFGDTGTPGTILSTPGSVHSTATSTGTSASQQQKPVVDTSLSLDAFQAKYTSEDNASFNDILDKQNEKRRNAYAWLWSGNNKIAGNRAKMASKLLRERAEKEEAEGGGEGRKSIAWVDDRKAAPETWKSRPRNDFMFIPEGVDDDLPMKPPALITGPANTGAAGGEDAQKKTLPPKSIAYSNTRITAAPDSSSSQIPPPSPSFSAIQDAIAGFPRSSSVIQDGNATPRVNGYAFVDDEPTPSEISGMEWERERRQRGGEAFEPGSVGGGIPLPSSSSSSTGPSPFKIPPTPRREALLNRMVDKVAKGKRATAGNAAAVAAAAAAAAAGGSPAVGSGTPRFASARGLMTPAAQKLWSSVAASPRSAGMGGTPGRAGGGFGGEFFGNGGFGGGTPGRKAAAGGSAESLKAKLKFTPTPKRK